MSRSQSRLVLGITAAGLWAVACGASGDGMTTDMVRIPIPTGIEAPAHGTEISGSSAEATVSSTEVAIHSTEVPEVNREAPRQGPDCGALCQNLRSSRCQLDQGVSECEASCTIVFALAPECGQAYDAAIRCVLGAAGSSCNEDVVFAACRQQIAVFDACTDSIEQVEDSDSSSSSSSSDQRPNAG